MQSTTSTKSTDSSRTGVAPASKRRRHSDEFKDGAVRMVTEKNYTPGDAAKALGIDRSVLSRWIDKLAPGWRPSPPGPSDDPAVLQVQLRDALREVRELRTAVDILKKATAYFADPKL